MKRRTRAMAERARQPHKLTLYRCAVQHPEAEVRFLLETYAHDRGVYPTLLREDFAGTAAVAGAWVDFAPHHKAIAIDAHGPTLRWAKADVTRRLGDSAKRIRFMHSDVMRVRRPAADVIAALNFSICEWHDRSDLLRYLTHARRCLAQDGILVVDLFGGPGAMRLGTQTRQVTTDDGQPLIYHWEQRRFDHVAGRIDCRIHFTLPGGHEIRNAFRYDWRLWTPPELIDAMHDAGFPHVDLWCDRINPATGQSDSIYRPLRTMPAREDFVAYIVGLR